MRTLYTLLVASLLVLTVLPSVFAVSIGTGVGVDIGTEDFEPRVWLCGSRVALDDETEPGRLEGWRIEHCQYPSSYEICEDELLERTNNYAFEGEQIKWDVLVWDKNGIEKIKDVFGTVGDSQGAGNDIEVNCILDEVLNDQSEVRDSCNARELEEQIEHVEDNTAAYYTCIFTVETPESHYGEYWLTVEAEDLDGMSGTMDENEFWFLNPVVALSIEGDLTFDNVRPGVSAYSETLLVGNDADEGSGVLMDMFISGTDFYDSSSSGAKCPTSNQLVLGDGDSFCDVNSDFSASPNSGTTDPFCYFATHGGYSTLGGGSIPADGRSDVEGYVGINYGIGFNDPSPFYGVFNGDATGYEIIQSSQVGPYFVGNIVSPGSEIAVTFRLNLPEPCNGDFDTGSIYFWGEAI